MHQSSEKLQTSQGLGGFLTIASGGIHQVASRYQGGPKEIHGPPLEPGEGKSHRTAMNIRRGMFRLWTVASALFVIAVAYLSYPQIREEFRIADNDPADSREAIARLYGGRPVVPVSCNLARGNRDTDFSVSEGLCWYTIGDVKRLFPEYKDMTDQELSERLYAKAGRPMTRPHPWRRIMLASGIAFGVPLVVLTLGMSLGWAFAGFRRS